MALSTFKKLSLLFLTANTITIVGIAQIQVGVKGGLNIAEVLTTQGEIMTIGGTQQIARNFPMAGFNAGMFLFMPLSKKFSLQPELVYSAQGATEKAPNWYSVSAVERNKFNWINIPIMFKYNLPSGIFLETGPQVGFLVSAKITEAITGAGHGTDYYVQKQYQFTDLSWGLGIGFLTTYRLGLDVRYNLGLTNFSNVSASEMHNTPVQPAPMKNSVVQVGLFYVFGQPRTPEAPKE